MKMDPVQLRLLAEECRTAADVEHDPRFETVGPIYRAWLFDKARVAEHLAKSLEVLRRVRVRRSQELYRPLVADDS